MSGTETTPRWASVSTAHDDGVIEHYAPVGTLFPAEVGQPPFTVAVMQTDDPTGPEAVPAVAVLGVRLSRAEALELAGLLQSASELLTPTRFG